MKKYDFRGLNRGKSSCCRLILPRFGVRVRGSFVSGWGSSAGLGWAGVSAPGSGCLSLPGLGVVCLPIFAGVAGVSSPGVSSPPCRGSSAGKVHPRCGYNLVTK